MGRGRAWPGQAASVPHIHPWALLVSSPRVGPVLGGQGRPSQPSFPLVPWLASCSGGSAQLPGLLPLPCAPRRAPPSPAGQSQSLPVHALPSCARTTARPLSPYPPWTAQSAPPQADLDPPFLGSPRRRDLLDLLPLCPSGGLASSVRLEPPPPSNSSSPCRMGQDRWPGAKGPGGGLSLPSARVFQKVGEGGSACLPGRASPGGQGSTGAPGCPRPPPSQPRSRVAAVTRGSNNNSRPGSRSKEPLPSSSGRL